MNSGMSSGMSSGISSSMSGANSMPNYQQLVNMYQQQLQAAAATGQFNPYSSTSSLSLTSAPQTGYGVGGSYNYGNQGSIGSSGSSNQSGSKTGNNMGNNKGIPSYSTYNR
jgi:hypothetical protein